MGPIGCPETSVTNCYSTMREVPEERRSDLDLFPSQITYLLPAAYYWSFRILQSDGAGLWVCEG